MRLFSPAKINLFFKLGEKREDGYHNISSLFQAISLGDYIEIDHASEDSFESNDQTLGFNDANFIIKALFYFREKTSLSHPLRIKLEKNIPMETGVGGGSSNASTLLWGLNELFGQPLSLGELQELALRVTSDSPFFFSSGTALCEGRGEVLHEMPPLEGEGYLIKPPYGVSTKDAYMESSKHSKMSESAKTLVSRAYSSEPLFLNDLEEAAFCLCPQLKELKEDLLEHNKGELFMTGSGSGLVFLGNAAPKTQKPVQIFPFRYINRRLNFWYQDRVYEAVQR